MLDLERCSYKVRVRRLRKMAVVSTAEIRTGGDSFLATQQMLWVERKYVVGIEIASNPWLKYCYSMAWQSKYM